MHTDNENCICIYMERVFASRAVDEPVLKDFRRTQALVPDCSTSAGLIDTNEIFGNDDSQNELLYYKRCGSLIDDYVVAPASRSGSKKEAEGNGESRQWRKVDIGVESVLANGHGVWKMDELDLRDAAELGQEKEEVKLPQVSK